MPSIQNLSDAALLSRFAGGDMRAYEQIFTRYYSSLCAYTRLYVRGGEAGENIVQDLMLWLWENRMTLNITGSLSQYLFSATRNRCLNHINHENIERRVLGSIQDRMCEQFESPDFYIVTELREKIRVAVEALPKDYRDAFVMNRFERKTYREIAAELNVSVKTVDYRIQQSLKILRVKLKDYLPMLAFLLAMHGDMN